MSEAAGDTCHLEELGFWRRWFETRGDRWPQEYVLRQDLSRPLHWNLFELLGTPVGGTAEIIDVGAGPMTSLGKVWTGRTLKITAVDPLAEGYDQLLAEFGITPPVRTIKGDATRLVEQFGEGRFDLVHGHNAIDHSADSPRAVREMFAIVRPGGSVFLAHARNEGERQKYAGMHRWNFDGREVNGRTHFIVWNRSKTVDITAELGPAADIQVKVLPEWINVTMRKAKG